MEIHKQYVLDEDRRPVAVQVPIAEFQRIEEVLEDYGLARLMDESEDAERLSGDAAKQYYRSLKDELGR